MISEKDRWRLEHLRDAIAAIRAYAVGDRRADLVLHAVLHNIVVIGEAAGRMTEETQALAPEVPWREVIAMRNIVAHEYFRVDHAIVWQMVDRHLDGLESAVDRLLAG